MADGAAQGGVLARDAFRSRAESMLEGLQNSARVHALLLCEPDRQSAYGPRDVQTSRSGLHHRVGRMLAGLCRRTADLIGEWPEQRLVLICGSSSREQLMDHVEGLRRSIQREALAHAANLPWGVVTASFGLTWVRPISALDTLLEEAELALQGARDGGRNRVVTVAESRSGGLRRPG